MYTYVCMWVSVNIDVYGYICMYISDGAATSDHLSTGGLGNPTNTGSTANQAAEATQATIS